MRREFLLPAAGIALLILSALVVLLSMNNRKLRESNAALSRSAASLRQASLGLPVGVKSPFLRATAMDGDSFAIGEEGSGPRVLYFFSPSCKFCLASSPFVRDLSQRLPEAGPLVGITHAPAAELAAYAQAQGFDFPVVNDEEEVLFKEFRTSVVPMLVVIDRQGRIAYVHTGRIGSDDVEKAISAYTLGKLQLTKEGLNNSATLRDNVSSVPGRV